jgi:hypothetical protein
VGIYSHHHHHVSFMELGHLLTHSGLTCPEASSKVCHGSLCQSGSSVSLPWVVYYEAFCLHVLSSFSCIPVICPKLELFLTPLQFVYLFCKFSEFRKSCTSVLKSHSGNEGGWIPCNTSNRLPTARCYNPEVHQLNSSCLW